MWTTVSAPPGPVGDEQLREGARRLRERTDRAIIGLFGGTYYVFKEKVRTGGFWRPQPKEMIVVYCERPVGTDVKLSSETIKLLSTDSINLLRVRVTHP